MWGDGNLISMRFSFPANVLREIHRIEAVFRVGGAADAQMPTATWPGEGNPHGRGFGWALFKCRLVL